MQRLSIIIMFLTAFAKLFGFLREMILPAYYGAGAISDAYIFANNLPSTLFTVVAAAFVSGFIPMFTRISQRDEKEANQFMANVQNIMLLACAIITGFTLLFPEVIINVFLDNSNLETMTWAVAFLRITVFGTFFVSIIQLTTGYLNIKESFILPTLLPISMNIIVITCIAISTKTTPYILAYGSLLGNVVQGLIIYFYAYRKGYRHRMMINFKDENLKKMLALSVPVILSSGFGFIGSSVTQRFASNEFTGGISILNYANKLIGFVQGMFITTITTVTYPSIAKYAALGEKEKFNNSVNQSLVGMALFVVPAAIAFFALSNPLIALVFQRGKFGPEQTALTAPLFQALAFSLIGIGFREIFTRIFYSHQDMKTPLIYSIVFVIINIGLNIVFVYIFNIGIAGLGISTSVAHIVAMLLMAYSTKKKIGFGNLRALIVDLVKIAGSSVLMGIGAYYLFQIMAGIVSSTIAVIFTAFCGVVFYGIMVILLRVSFADQFIMKFREKFGG